MTMHKRIYFLFLCVQLFYVANGFSLRSKEKEREDVLNRLLDCLFENDCEEDEPSRRNNLPYSSIIYLNGKIYTVDGTDWDANPKQAIVIEDEKIAFVGSEEDAEEYYIPYLSKVYDLHGSVVLPGFHDVHMHPLEAMSPLGGACVLKSMTRPDDKAFTEELSTCETNRVGTEWVLGTGHSITPMLQYIKEGNSPRKLLDSFISDRPAAMLEETSHSAWVNSKALEKARITASTAERPGGVIMREQDSNEPNGILFENEAISIFELAMSPDGNEQVLDYNYDGLVDAMSELAKNGITSVCDARLFWKIKHDEAWDEVCNDNKLTARAVLGLWAYPNEDDDKQIHKLKELYSSALNPKCSLRKTQIKVYMDGIVESTTASMFDEYLINLSLPIISKKNVGMNYFDKERLKRYIKELQGFDNGKGFDFHIHAIGDRGISDALDAIEEAQDGRKHRHRLTHLEILDPKDVKRFKELGVIADFQVAGDFTLPSEHEELATIIGHKKAHFSIPVKSVVDTGAVSTFSSDWDVSTLNPFIGIQHATERGKQSVDVKTAIEMYTRNPAFAMRQEDTVGRLREGMEADLIIIDQDILTVNPDKISATKVQETVFMGESIYRNKDSKIKDITWLYELKDK